MHHFVHESLANAKLAKKSMANQRTEHNAEKYIHVYYNAVANDTGRLAVVASKICKIPRNSLKILTYTVQRHLRSSILVSIESVGTR